MEALHASDKEEFALSLLTTNQLRSWPNMTEKVGSTISLETVGLDLFPLRRAVPSLRRQCISRVAARKLEPERD
jgi:hypothetical protein